MKEEFQSLVIQLNMKEKKNQLELKKEIEKFNLRKHQMFAQEELKLQSLVEQTRQMIAEANIRKSPLVKV